MFLLYFIIILNKKNTFQEMFSSNPEFLAQFQVKLAPGLYIILIKTIYIYIFFRK
jgi:hypothetical protein